MCLLTTITSQNAQRRRGGVPGVPPQGVAALDWNLASYGLPCPLIDHVHLYRFAKNQEQYNESVTNVESKTLAVSGGHEEGVCEGLAIHMGTQTRMDAAGGTTAAFNTKVRDAPERLVIPISRYNARTKLAVLTTRKQPSTPGRRQGPGEKKPS